MSEQLQLRRGTASQVAAFTGAQGELAVDTTNNVLHVNDGATAGGWPLALATRTAVSDAAYSALVTDRLIAYTALTAARTVTLPSAASYPTGAQIIVIDETGNCSNTKTITVSRAGSDTIDGAASAVIAGPYGVLALESNGSNAWTVTHSRVASNARTAVSDAPYSALTSDRLIAYTAITAARVVSLLAAAAYPTGTQLTVVDESGSCSATDTITISRAGSDTINGATSIALNAAYGYATIETNGSNAWTIIDSSGVAAVTSGSINGATIGATAPAAGSFTTLSLARHAVADAAYSVAAGISIVAYTSITAARAVTLPAANSFAAGQQLLVLDESGSCSVTNTITLNRTGSDVINGGGGGASATSAVIAQPFGQLTLESNGSNAWTIVNVAPMNAPFFSVTVRSLNLNATGDTVVPVPLPNGYSRYLVTTVRVCNASTSLTTAKLGLYTAASQGGVTLLAQSALSTITSSSPNAADDMVVLSPITTTYLNQASFYLNVGTAQGAAATADVAIQIIPLS